MTNPTLERAARAAADVGAECGLQTNDGAASWEEIGVHYADIARAVLMAVLPTLERVDIEEQGPCGRGWLAAVSSPDGEYVRYEDLQAILNDGEGE